MKKEIKEIVYEKYQLDWMLRHGHSINELLKILKEAIEENDTYEIVANTADYAEEYFEDHGFDGEMYVCYDEFIGSEYTDVQYMRQLLSEEEFLEYLKDNFSAYDYFEVSSDGFVEIFEYGYMAEDSVTDNPEETSRIVECSGAEFEQADLTGDEDDDTDMTNYVLEDAKQYIEDVTDRKLCMRMQLLLVEGAVETDNGYHDKTLRPGKYIWLR